MTASLPELAHVHTGAKDEGHVCQPCSGDRGTACLERFGRCAARTVGRVPTDPFAEDLVEAISAVLGDTDTGLTGTEIGRLLDRCTIADPGAITKRRRIHEALVAEQRRSRSGTCVVMFIHAAMKPTLYVGQQPAFENRRSELNQVLSFAGLAVKEDGRLHKSAKASTLSEAAAIAGRLRAEMLRRGAHAEVLRYCTAELVEGDCFDAVFEAVKGLGERLREVSGLDGDGSKLIQSAMGGPAPVLAINSLRTETERNEQSGLVNMMTGVFGAFRNPAAHRPKSRWHVTEPDALDLLTTLSLIHRRLDRAVRTGISGA